MLNNTPNRQWAYALIERYNKEGYRGGLSPAAVEIAFAATRMEQAEYQPKESEDGNFQKW